MKNNKLTILLLIFIFALSSCNNQNDYCSNNSEINSNYLSLYADYGVTIYAHDLGDKTYEYGFGETNSKGFNDPIVINNLTYVDFCEAKNIISYYKDYIKYETTCLFIVPLEVTWDYIYDVMLKDVNIKKEDELLRNLFL